MATNSLATQRALTAGLRSLSLTSTTRVAAVRFASTSSSSSNSYERARMPRLPPVAPLPSRIKPTSPAYYTGRPAYIDTLLSLEQLARQTKRLLEQSHLLPPNSAAPLAATNATNAGGARQNLWVNSTQLQQILGCNLKAAQYRQIVSRLALLARYAPLVAQFEAKADELHHVLRTTSDESLIDTFHATLERFMNENAKSNNLLAEKDADKALWESSMRNVDGKGRAYSKGRRKESSAQVWIVRTKSPSVSESEPHIGQILINNTPISHYFTRTAEREVVTWPLKLTSNLGAYNVFALVRGGGKSGQAGAIAHAIANAIVTETAHDLDMHQGLVAKKFVKQILAKDGVLKRDPRMVERKKTGKAKARKAFTWVKR